MLLNVTGHHVDVTSSLKDYVGKKLDRIVRHSDKVIDVHCILTVEKLRHKAEATVLLSGAKVYADATELEQIILNLVSNARDAITGEGSITLSTERTAGLLCDVARSHVVPMVSAVTCCEYDVLPSTVAMAGSLVLQTELW